MTVDSIVHFVTGTTVMASLALAHYSDPTWLWLTGAVGLSLAQSALTNFCPLGFMLKRAGVKEGDCCS